jgi:hypothetical protein
VLVTEIQRTCVSVPDYLFDCRKPVAPDPATARESDIAKYLERWNKALDDCQRQARAVQAELGAQQCRKRGGN